MEAHTVGDMKIAVLSDIHGNLEALEAVWADLAPRQPEVVVCLGDLVGYGPDPEGVVKFVRERGWSAIQGNHEAALIDPLMREWMNFQARENHIATEALMSAESLDFCRSLPRTLELEGALFVHGCPPDSVVDYLYRMADSEITRIVSNQPQRLFFVGHTHELALVVLVANQVLRERLSFGEEHMLSLPERHIVNAGSVGQPRSGDSRAVYLLWDTEKMSIEPRAVNYDVRITAAKIIARGFPRAYADRLG